jgi:hypothetical protein
MGTKLEVYTRLICSQMAAEATKTDLGTFQFSTNFSTQTSSPSLNLFHYRSNDDNHVVTLIGGEEQEWVFVPLPIGDDVENWRNTATSTPSDPPEKSPDPGSACRQNPLVQKATTVLNVAMSSTMGVLSSLTTSFWASISDRYGRKKIVALSIFGAILNELVFLTTFNFPKIIGYQFLIMVTQSLTE